MKSVLIITGPLAGHGGEETLLKMVTQQLAKDYTVSLLISDLTGDLNWLGDVQSQINVQALPHELSKVAKLLRLLRLIRGVKADVVIALTPRMLLISHLASLLMFKRFKLISWLQFSIKDKFSPRTVKLLHYAKAHMVLNSAMALQLIESGIPQEQTHVILNPVQHQERVIHSSISAPARFVCMARIQLQGQKNLQELFHALSMLKGDWRLDLYGGDDSLDQVETQKSLALLKQLNISDRVIWHGFVSEPWNQIHQADALVLTSQFEGFGLVLVEAASYGLPVISSDCPVGPREIVNDSNGRLYHLGDVAELADELQRFVDRQTHYDVDRVKQSIAPFYLDQYMNNFKMIIEG